MRTMRGAVGGVKPSPRPISRLPTACIVAIILLTTSSSCRSKDGTQVKEFTGGIDLPSAGEQCGNGSCDSDETACTCAVDCAVALCQVENGVVQAAQYSCNSDSKPQATDLHQSRCTFTATKNCLASGCAMSCDARNALCSSSPTMFMKADFDSGVLVTTICTASEGCTVKGGLERTEEVPPMPPTEHDPIAEGRP